MVNQIRAYMKKYGFVVAAETMKFHDFNRHQLANMLKGWETYPGCLAHYPTQLTEKHYTDSDIPA